MTRVLMTAASFTRPSDTNAYASGDLVANNTTAGSVVVPTFACPRVGRDLVIPRCRLSKSAGPVANAQFRVHFFGSIPTFTNGDNGALAPTALFAYLGYLEATFPHLFAGWAVPVIGEAAPCWQPTASTDVLYAVLEARAAYVPTSAEVLTIVPELEIP